MMDGAYVTEVLSGLTLFGVAWLVRGVSAINRHLAELNHRTSKLEEWAHGHERLDDERYRMVMDRIAERRAP
jgi:hypothetical protein